MTNIIECANLTKCYDMIPALAALTLNLPQGKIIGLLGPNGSGKTTLIKLMAGLLTPSFGSIRIAGENIGVKTKEIVSYLPERGYFDRNTRVSECVNMFEDFYADFDKEHSLNLLNKFSVPTDVKVKTLSKGTYEKLQLILVMSRKARLYLLDEPIGGVDPAARDNVLSIILDNMRTDATILISTHLISDIERILDDIVFLKYGKVILHSSADEIRQTNGMSIDEVFREEFRC